MVWTKAGARRLLTALGIGFGSVLAMFGADKAEAAPNCKYQYKMTEDKSMPPGIGKEYAEYASRKILMKYDDCGQRIYTDWNGRVLDSGKKASKPDRKTGKQAAGKVKASASGASRVGKGTRDAVVVDAHTGKSMVVVARGNDVVPDGYAVPEVREILPTPESEKPSGFFGKVFDWVRNGPDKKIDVFYSLKARHLSSPMKMDETNPGAIFMFRKPFLEPHEEGTGFWGRGWYFEYGGGYADNSFFACRGTFKAKNGKVYPVGCNVDKNTPDTPYAWFGVGKELGKVHLGEQTNVAFRLGYDIGLAGYDKKYPLPRVFGQVPILAFEACADINDQRLVGGKVSVCTQADPHPDKKGKLRSVFTFMTTEVRVNMPVDFNGWVMGSTSLTDKPASSKEPFAVAAKGKKAMVKATKPKRVMSEKLLQRHAAKVVASVR